MIDASKAAEAAPAEGKNPAEVLAETLHALETVEAITVHWLFFSRFDEDLPAEVLGNRVPRLS
ncbi:MAG TPA: hypothetical protein VF179_20380, partial [Thermoanaerobaculia bacterium]|nr:hypothetical protein [Thermoanaerobaculia bacterium]